MLDIAGGAWSHSLCTFLELAVSHRVETSSHVYIMIIDGAVASASLSLYTTPHALMTRYLVYDFGFLSDTVCTVERTAFNTMISRSYIIYHTCIRLDYSNKPFSWNDNDEDLLVPEPPWAELVLVVHHTLPLMRGGTS